MYVLDGRREGTGWVILCGVRELFKHEGVLVVGSESFINILSEKNNISLGFPHFFSDFIAFSIFSGYIDGLCTCGGHTKCLSDI